MQATDLKNIFNNIKPQATGTGALANSATSKSTDGIINTEFMNMLDGALLGDNSHVLNSLKGSTEQQTQLLSLLQSSGNMAKPEMQELFAIVKGNVADPNQMQAGIEQLLEQKPQLREVLAEAIEQSGGFEKIVDPGVAQEKQLNQLASNVEKQNPLLAKKTNPYQKAEMTEDMERVIKPKRNSFFVNNKQNVLKPVAQTGEVNNVRKMAVQQTVGHDGITSFSNLQNTTGINRKVVNQYAKDQGTIETNILRPDFQNKSVATTDSQNINPVMVKDDVAMMTDANTTAEQEAVVLPLNKLESTPITNNSAKVMNITNLGNVDSVELIDKIADYVKQSSFQNRQNLDLMVQHDALGKFKVSVSKLKHAANQLEMKVVTSTGQGHAFFAENQSALVKSLGDAGITVTGFKVLASADFGITTNSESREFSMNSGDGSGKDSNFASNKRDSQDADSQRRKELWEEYKERYGT